MCKVTINCGHRGGGDRVRHLLEGRVRVIISGGARVYLPSIPSILLRAPRMVAVRGPGEGGPFGVTTATGRVLPTALPGRGRVAVRRGGMGGGGGGQRRPEECSGPSGRRLEFRNNRGLSPQGGECHPQSARKRGCFPSLPSDGRRASRVSSLGGRSAPYRPPSRAL